MTKGTPQPTMTIDEAIQAMYQGKTVTHPESPKTWHWKDNVIQWVESAQWFHPETFRNRGPEHGWQVVPSPDSVKDMGEVFPAEQPQAVATNTAEAVTGIREAT